MSSQALHLCHLASRPWAQNVNTFGRPCPSAICWLLPCFQFSIRITVYAWYEFQYSSKVQNCPFSGTQLTLESRRSYRPMFSCRIYRNNTLHSRQKYKNLYLQAYIIHSNNVNAIIRMIITNCKLNFAPGWAWKSRGGGETSVKIPCSNFRA